jgi:transposase
MDIRRLIQLKQGGMSNRRIGKALDMSRNTVNGYIKYFEALDLDYGTLLAMDDKQLHDLFPEKENRDMEKYDHLRGLFSYYSKEMVKPGCTLLTLWHGYLEERPEGYRYTQFAHHYGQWKNRQKPSGILEHTAGEKLMVDYTGKTIPYIDKETGEVLQAQVFVGILPCSQYTFVHASTSQKREDFICSLNTCLQYVGGTPKAIISDNLKSAVSKGHKYAPEINKTLSGFALHHGLVIDPARPYRPQDKALVEGAVKLVYQRIFYKLSEHTFFSIGDINEAINPLLEQYNDYLFQRAQVSRRQRFEELERPHLGSLPQSVYQIRQYRRARVQKIAHIYLSEDKNYYSVPYRYITKQVEVQYDKDHVEVFYDRERIASHKRSYRGGQYSTVKDHMPSTHQAYTDWSPEYFSQRAVKIGPCTQAYLKRLIEQYDYPEVGYKQALGILAMTKGYPAARVEAACEHGLAGHRCGYRVIENILKNDYDQTAIEESPPPIPPHENIRGEGYYQ